MAPTGSHFCSASIKENQSDASPVNILRCFCFMKAKMGKGGLELPGWNLHLLRSVPPLFVPPSGTGIVLDPAVVLFREYLSSWRDESDFYLPSLKTLSFNWGLPLFEDEVFTASSSPSPSGSILPSISSYSRCITWPRHSSSGSISPTILHSIPSTWGRDVWWSYQLLSFILRQQKVSSWNTHRLHASESTQTQL